MRRMAFILLLLCLTTWLVAEELTLFYTNDTHGTYLPADYKSVYGTTHSGGYSGLEYVLNGERKQAHNPLWLDAGDQQTGSAFSALEYEGAIGGACIEAFNRLGLDGAALGNHEFDLPLANTRKLMKLAKYPFINANIVDNGAKATFTGHPYVIFTRGNLKIGVLGLIMTDLSEKVKADNVKGLTVLPYVSAVDKYLDELDKQTDLIILLTHIGLEADSLLATQLDSRVDMIVGGHSHDVLKQPLDVNGILIVQTGSHLQYLGEMQLDVQDDHIVKWDDKLVPLVEPPDYKTPFTEWVDTVAKQIDAKLGEVLGTIPVDWIPDKYHETAVSRWEAMALFKRYQKKYHPDIAMINCGGIRKSIPAGEVNLGQMQEALPFDNKITFFSCYGKDLPGYIGHNLAVGKSQEHDIVQSYNLSWSEKAENGSIVISDIRVGGKPVKADKLYKIVSHDYLAGQGAKYLDFTPLHIQTLKDNITEVLIKEVHTWYGQKKL